MSTQPKKRGRPPNPLTKRRRMEVNLTDSERAELKARAAEAGQTPSDYLLTAAGLRG